MMQNTINKMENLKSDLETVQFLQSTRNIQTNIFINVCVLIVRALRSRSLLDGSLPHKGRFATFVRSC